MGLDGKDPLDISPVSRSTADTVDSREGHTAQPGDTDPKTMGPEKSLHDSTISESQAKWTFSGDQKSEGDEASEDDWEHDPRNPRNWKDRKKWIMVGVVSFYTLVPPLASSMMAPALPEIAEHFHIHDATLKALTLSVFLLTFALGPLFLGPLSELYGRTWILHICNLLSLVLNMSCGFVPTAGGLIGLRVLSGFAGSAPVAIGGGTVSDLFSDRNRANAMAVYSLVPLLGPALGPVAGGYITQTVGFKYVFVVIGSLSAVCAAVGIPLLKETYAPVIRLKIARQTGDLERAAREFPELVGNGWQLIWLNISRPFILLTRSFVCFILSLYMALQYGFYYLMFSVFAELFETTYGFTSGSAGLAYLGLGAGFITATLCGGHFGNKTYRTMSARNGGKGKPEFRIPALIFGSLFPPIGLLWFGWSAQAATHWIVPILGTSVFGFGMMTTFLPIQLYLVDTFTFAASATAAAAVFRSLLAFAFPLFGAQMFHALGYGGGNSLLAGLAIVCGIPFPIWLYFYGEKIRMKSSLAR